VVKKNYVTTAWMYR